MEHISISYLLTNRGRYISEVSEETENIIREEPNFIMIYDESDATDINKGLDGRNIFKWLKEKHKNITIRESQDPEVGVNFICSPNIFVESIEYTQINKANLKFPQGRSERYKHHRLVTKLRFNDTLKADMNFDGINIICQHNSAFLRPITRAIQSIEAMRILKKLQNENPKYLSVLIRDQNTMIPGEGKFERLLRKIFNLDCLTDKVERIYDISKLETDTGGLNKFAGWFNKIGGFKLLRKVITIADKVETMCIIKEIDNKLDIHITPKHKELKLCDHGLLSINIQKN